MRHCKKRRSLVCGSVMAAERRVMLVWTLLSLSMKNSRNVGDPTGEPSRRKPVVSSAGIGGAEGSDWEGWREYFTMVLDMEAGRVGSRLERVLSGE